MLPFHLYFYYLEGSALYLQNKIWGRYYNESTGRKFVGMSTTCFLVFWLYLGIEAYKLNVFLVGGVALIPMLLWLSYSFSKGSNNPSELKIEEFRSLNPFAKWVCLIYTTLIMVIAPVLIIIALILRAYKLV